jgi:hypothetical protein
VGDICARTLAGCERGHPNYILLDYNFHLPSLIFAPPSGYAPDGRPVGHLIYTYTTSTEKYNKPTEKYKSEEPRYPATEKPETTTPYAKKG